MELKGSKTEQNLMTAFAGESQARNKYTYYASKAKKDGYEQIAAIFEETANNEKEHAKMWYKLLNGGEVNDTISNLKEAADGENYEWTDMYKEMAETAREEANIAVSSGEQSWSTDNTIEITCTSFLNPFGNSGRIGRSIIRAARVAASLGRPSLLIKPPGIFPTEYSFS